MNKKLLISTFLILIFLGGLVSVSISIGSPQSFWKTKHYTDNITQKFNHTQEVPFIQQKGRMKTTPNPSNKSDSQDFIRAQESAGWRVYTKTDPQFSYRVEYPSDWSVEESGNISFFTPPYAKSKQESIAIIVINYKKTPPLPVQYTYTTIRTVPVDAEKVLVREREPSPVTEKYFAEIKKGDYTGEFRFSIDHQYDDVFDHMLSTFKFVE